MHILSNLHFWRVWLPPHLLALGGLLAFGIDPATMLTAFIAYCLISGLGVAVGLHRFFSHKAFETSKLWEQLMLFFGCMACHGNPLFWVALHRGLHHRYADKEKDAHSPRHGLWHSYQGYAFTIDPATVPLRAGADFLRHKDWQWTVTHYHKILWSSWIVLAILAYMITPALLVGVALAQVWAIHQEALVNLVGHLPGFGAYRNYETDDDSVNRPLLGVLTWGQALHNNHHGDAGDPNFGSRRWYELDPSMLWIGMIRT